MIENVQDSIRRADALFAEGSFEKALAVYEEARTNLNEVEDQTKLREDARIAQLHAEAQMLLVRSATLPVDLLIDVDAIEFKHDEAMIHFQSGNFDQAREVWITVASSATELLKKAGTNRGVGADP
jgi:hypothetical protein